MLNSGRLAGKTVFITGASRGIGQSIAEKCAVDGANIVIAAKTATAHPTLPGTIYTVAESVEKLGGRSLPCVVDIRDEAQVEDAVNQAVKKFGGIDIVINNASAISLTPTAHTTMKKYDLMNSINARGTFLVSQKCLPYLKQSQNPHILNISPPLSMKPIWFKNHVAYTMAKYGMSMCVLGMAAEFAELKIAVNALWPRTAIATAAVEMLGGDDMMAVSRKPDIMADAAYTILGKDSGNFTGNFAVDEDILRAEGVTDFEPYSCVPGSKLLPDFFLDDVVDAEQLHGTWEKSVKKQLKSQQQGSASSPEAIIEAMKSQVTPDIMSEIGKVFVFRLSGPQAGDWFIDLKTGSSGSGDNSGVNDVIMKMDSNDFLAMVQGKLNSTQAFMSGKLVIDGDMFAAMKLEKLMKKMQKSKL